MVVVFVIVVVVVVVVVRTSLRSRMGPSKKEAILNVSWSHVGSDSV